VAQWTCLLEQKAAGISHEIAGDLTSGMRGSNLVWVINVLMQARIWRAAVDQALGRRCCRHLGSAS